MSNYNIYKTDTGEVQYSITGTLHPEDVLPGLSSIEGEFDVLTQYVDVNQTPHAIASKIEMSITLNKIDFDADLVDSIIITGLPVPVDVVWPVDTQGTITDGVAEFLTNTPGDYQIIFSGIQYLEEIVSITAHSI